MKTELEKQLNLDAALRKIFWDEIGEIIRPDTLKEEIYHYTNLEGLKGILTNKQVWMTDSRFLNDMSELNHFETLVEETKDLFYQKLLKDCEKEEIDNNDLLNIFFEVFDDAVEKRFKNPEDKFEVYVMSLSENKDSLTLWGNYAKGKGYNLCFNANSLLSKVNEIANGRGYMVYGEVIYNRDIQLEKLSEALIIAFKKISDIKIDIDLEEDNLRKELLSFFKNLIISYSIFFKHHSFEPEEEFRIAYTIEDYDKVEFRTNDEAIIPFLKMNFDKSDIKRIIVGPKNNSDIAEIGVKTYLDKLGYDLAEVIIDRSEIPLRF